MQLHNSSGHMLTAAETAVVLALFDNQETSMQAAFTQVRARPAPGTRSLWPQHRWMCVWEDAGFHAPVDATIESCIVCSGRGAVAMNGLDRWLDTTSLKEMGRSGCC